MEQLILTQILSDINFDKVRTTVSLGDADRATIINLWTVKNNDVICIKCMSTNVKIRGSKMRRIKHAAFTYQKIIINFNARQYICKKCSCNFKEDLPAQFEGKVSHGVDIMIFENLKCIKINYDKIASMHNVSTQYVRDFLEKLERPCRVRLPEFLSFDEVYTCLNVESKYSFVMINPLNSELIDILPTRKKTHLLGYFYSISKEERDKVKMICIDMNKDYKDVIHSVFPKAVLVVDSFHVARLVTTAMQSVRKRIMKRYAYDESYFNYRVLKKEYHLLTTRDKNIKGKYTNYKKMNAHLSLTPSQRIEYMLGIDEEMKKAHFLCHQYLDYNEIAKYSKDAEKFFEIVETFAKSGIPEFIGVSKTLSNWLVEILNLFIRVKKRNKHYGKKKDEPEFIKVKLTNAAIERFNLDVGLLLANSFGMKNFENFRTRMFLYNKKDINFTLKK